jgi:hypothetical protein
MFTMSSMVGCAAESNQCPDHDLEPHACIMLSQWAQPVLRRQNRLWSAFLSIRKSKFWQTFVWDVGDSNF